MIKINKTRTMGRYIYINMNNYEHTLQRKKHPMLTLALNENHLPVLMH